MKKGDILIIFAIVFILSMYFIFFQQKNIEGDIYVQIRVNNELKYNILVDENTKKQIEIKDYGYNIIEIDGYQVYMAYSDCPNQDCVHTGKIEPNPGLFQPQAIICAPNRISVTFSGYDSNDLIPDDVVN